MGRAAVPPTNNAADPYGPAQGTRGWVWRRDGWFACLGLRKETHQKTDLGLRWPLFDDKYNNQLGVCVRGGRDVGEEARGV